MEVPTLTHTYMDGTEHSRLSGDMLQCYQLEVGHIIGKIIKNDVD